MDEPVKHMSLPGLKGTVLLVDDDESVLGITTLALRRLGLSVVACRDGREALECLHATVFDLLLIDHNLPGASGLEVAERWREREPADRRMAVVLMSGDPPALRPGGVDAILLKPMGLDMLAGTIAPLLGCGGPPGAT